MRFALAPLAFGTWTTWLLAGPFISMLEKSLPFHDLEVESTWQMVLTVVTAPATWLALAVIAAGLAAWWQRERLAWLGRPLSGLGKAAEEGFWFDRFNRWIAEVFQNAASTLCTLQTGQLNWNLFAVIAGLLAVLVFLAWGVTGGI
jgi:NADH-quinone oxidoreductase subunit L